jgi:hypothetical protein
MIVDYNYKPYVYSAPPGITFYAPPSKNNKGAIVLIGVDDLANIYTPQITFITPTGEGLVLTLDNTAPPVSGSINDMFMQFKRENTAASSVTKTSEIAMVPYQNASFLTSASAPIFIPMSYLSMTFTVVGTPSSWARPLTIITLY